MKKTNSSRVQWAGLDRWTWMVFRGLLPRGGRPLAGVLRPGNGMPAVVVVRSPRSPCTEV